MVDPAAAVRWMLAMQGQDLPGAKWSVGLRVPGSTIQDVHDAFDRGDIIRSWPMRGTLHVVAAEDIGWMLELTAGRTLQSLRTRHRELGLDESTVAIAEKAAVELLEGGRSATRAELFAAFSAAGIDTNGQRGPHLLGRLHQGRLLCLGPIRGNEQAVVLLDEWVPTPRVVRTGRGTGGVRAPVFRQSRACHLARLHLVDKASGSRRQGGTGHRQSALDEIVIDGTSYWMSPGLSERPARRCTPFQGSTSSCWATRIGALRWLRSTPNASCPAATACSCRRSW